MKNLNNYYGYDNEEKTIRSSDMVYYLFISHGDHFEKELSLKVIYHSKMRFS